MRHHGQCYSVYHLDQLLLDYNDLQKVPFYGMLDEALNRDGLRLRYAAA
jgi:hypothetical protein